MPLDSTDTPPLDALVIGAGFAGMYALHSLRDRLGLKVAVLEAGGGVGGTWYWNRYPGARCDSESHSYAYAFSEEIWRGWTWSQRYPDHAEIRRYMNYVADRLDLKRDIRFETRVTACRYDAAANLWRVETEKGGRFAARYLITGVGCLSTANIPKIPGLEEFGGDWYHTGTWPHEGVDFTGKRVGQIGTGSTGIQAVPVIAEQAGHLTVFQRTANYSVPAQNKPLTDAFKTWARENWAALRQTMQETVNGHAFTIEDRSVHDVSDEELQAILQKAWDVGGLQFRANFRDVLLDETANAKLAEFVKAKIRSIVKDPETAAKLADIDHPYAAKRPPIDSGYFEAYNRDNVTLIDVRADPIERITRTGIVLRSGREVALDIIVFATGFDAMTGPLIKLGIEGIGGRTLAGEWAAGPKTYLGLQVAGFPNLFTITGPGSPSVLCNMPVCIEQHVEWISDCIAHLRANGIARIDTTEAAMADWGQEVQRAANVTLLPRVKHSWYLGANVPGKPRVFMPYAGGMARYRKHCAEIAAKGYEGFVLEHERQQAAE
ncbi:MAG: NAD(P)/FAD-dependent oxidoreductase [Acetobacteraceae bacterium]|nr:NAD(P)/FAD-dependent oxidoreductase [Acetobacteraceae bacterium]